MITTISVPAVIKIVNNSNRALSFIPYRENFISVLAAGKTLEFTATTAGQVLYYTKQATEDLVITAQASFDENATNLIKLETPAIMTITNTSANIKTFQPYKENFDVNVAAGDSYAIEATTIGQVLYYNAQATEGLTVSYAKKA